MSPAAQPALLRLSPGDPIAIATRDIAAGERVTLDGVAITAAREIPLGHKMALRAIAPGEKIVKYAVPIGSASAPIAPGDWVHLHNLRSDYLPTYTHAAGDRFEETAS